MGWDLSTVEAIDFELAKLTIIEDAFHELASGLRTRRSVLVGRQVRAEVGPELTPELFMRITRWHELDSGTHEWLRGWFERNYGGKGIYQSGSFPNGQAILCVSMSQRKPITEQLGLLDFWPFLRPGPDRWGKDRAEIVLPIASALGSATLHANLDRSLIWICRNRSPIYRCLDDLMEALRYIYHCIPNVPR